MFFIDDSIPEDDAHIISFWFSECKYQCVIEVSPHVLRLDIGKQDVTVHSQSYSEPVPFPAERVYYSTLPRHSQASDMLTVGVIELNYSLAVAVFYQ